MKLRGWIEEAEKKIARLDAELIAMRVLGFEDRTDIILYWEDEFDMSKADEMLVQRMKKTPLAYVLGYKEFYGRKFKVNPNVLIPRPETEQIITSVLGIIDVEKKNDVSILDVGTGSGCIPITLKLELNAEGVMSDISGVDVSVPALDTAQENADDMIADVKFFRSDLMKAIDKLPDIITANLPYVDMSWDWVSPEIKYEPALALYAEDGGLIYIKRLVDEISEMRKKELEEATVSDVPSKFLILEADTSQHDIIIEYVRNHGFELLSKDRFIITLRY